MTESSHWTRPWRKSLNFVARLKHDFNKKVVSYYFPEYASAASLAPQEQPWSTELDPNEASGSNHTSAPNSQYFDAVDWSEYIKQHKLSEIPPSSAILDRGNGVHIHHPFSPTHQESVFGDFDRYPPLSVNDYVEFSEPMSSLHEAPAPSMSMQVSGDTVETRDSNLMDTGDSSRSRGYVLPPEPLHQQRRKKMKNLTIEDIRRCLLQGEDGGSCSSSSYQGIKRRRGKWVAEIRVSRMPDKVWLGSFPLEKQAALAYDLGLHHCSMKRNKVFNFHESPRRLGPSQYAGLLKMSKHDRKVKVQAMASHYALTFGSSNS